MSQISKGSGGGNGDGNLFYDGDKSTIGGSTNIPIESLRMKHIRDGIEDHELMTAAARVAGRKAVLAVLDGSGAFAHPFQFTSDPRQLLRTRNAVAALLTGGKHVARSPHVAGTGHGTTMQPNQ